MPQAVTPEQAENSADIRDLSPAELHQHTKRGLVLEPPQTAYEILRAELGALLAQSLTNEALAILGEQGVMELADEVLNHPEVREAKVVSKFEATQQQRDKTLTEYLSKRTQNNADVDEYLSQIRELVSPDVVTSLAADVIEPSLDEDQDAEEFLSQRLGGASFFCYG